MYEYSYALDDVEIDGHARGKVEEKSRYLVPPNSKMLNPMILLASSLLHAAYVVDDCFFSLFSLFFL